MSIERLGQACVAISVLVLASSVQIAAAGNIIQNSSFEVPKVPRGFVREVPYRFDPRYLRPRHAG